MLLPECEAFFPSSDTRAALSQRVSGYVVKKYVDRAGRTR